MFSCRYTYTSTATKWNSCYQIAVADTIATTNLAAVPLCATYTNSMNPVGKKRRKRSDLMNNEVFKTSVKITPSKV